jgi:Zn-dependent protease
VDTSNLLQTILVYALPVLFAITVHEAAHGYAARALGDNTAASMGRLTLNPLPHIDPIGTILIPLVVLYLSKGAFVFGYAKPVPVISRNLRNPKRDMVWVALAGPASNFVQAIAWAIILIVLKALSIEEPFFNAMADAGVVVNLILWAFNLFPLPPLDGGRILVGLLPYQAASVVSRIEPFGFFIVLALAYTHVIGTVWLLPLVQGGFAFISLMLTPLQMLFG